MQVLEVSFFSHVLSLCFDFGVYIEIEMNVRMIKTFRWVDAPLANSSIEECEKYMHSRAICT